MFLIKYAKITKKIAVCGVNGFPGVLYVAGMLPGAGLASDCFTILNR